MMSYSKGESHLRHTDKVVRRIKSEDFRVGGGGGGGGIYGLCLNLS